MFSIASLFVAGPAAFGNGGYTIGLSMYSLRELFQSGELDALDYPSFARDTFGIRHVDVWYGGLSGKEVGNPEYYTRLRAKAAEAGVDIFLLMTGTIRATGGDAAEQQGEAQRFFVDVDRAVLLGARYLRLFVQAAEGDREQAVAMVVETLRPLADYARERQVTLVIEPGGSAYSKDGVFLAEVARMIDHPACKLMPDFGKMLGADPYGGTEAMMPYTEVVSAKMHNIGENGETADFDYPRLMDIVKRAGFSGIVAIEFEGRTPGPVEGVSAALNILQDLNQ